MTENNLDIEKYLSSYNRWYMLIQYIADNNTRYADIDISSADSARKDLKSSCKYISTVYERDLIRRALDRLCDHPHSGFSRQNIYRLLYVLRINQMNENGISTAVTEANNFLLNYMHEPELSARNLEEFIHICALNQNKSWEDVYQLLNDDDIRSAVEDQSLAPNPFDSYEGQTMDVFEEITSLQSADSVKAYILSNKNFFAHLGNTHYFSLFNDIYITAREKDGMISYRIIEELFPEYQENYSKSGIFQMKEYYTHLFGIYSLDEEADEFDNHLSAETISSLVKTFPDVFLTQDVFNEVVQKRRKMDISSGTFLLHLLADLAPDEYEPYSDVRTAVTEFSSTCNYYLNIAGFPSLNQLVPIEHLIMDVYEFTITTIQDDRYKEQFLFNFRDILTRIAQSCNTK